MRKVTVDLPERHKEKKVPMLDLCVWLDDQGDVKIIRHGFYEKPTTSPLVFHGRGACSTKQKITILSEEVKRRILNQDSRHSKEEREIVLRGFSQKLIDSGYTKEVRKEILASGVRRYYRLRLQDSNGVRNLYRTSEEMLQSRRKKSGLNGAWFRPRRGGKEVATEKNHPRRWWRQD